LTEVVFAIYHYYLIHFVQAPAPPSELPLDIRSALFQKVLHAGLSHPQVPSRLLDPSYRNDSYFAHAENMYEAGLMSAKDLHHARDHEYEDSMGIGRPRRRVGRITQVDKNVIDSFVEENEGDRERRLRQQIEADAMGIKDGDEEEQALEDAYGNPIMLHAHDRRAVEFRERLRTWSVMVPSSSLGIIAYSQVQSCAMGITTPAECAYMALIRFVRYTTRRRQEEQAIHDPSGKDYEDAGSEDWNDYTGRT